MYNAKTSDMALEYPERMLAGTESTALRTRRATVTWSQASTERKRNRLALETVETDSPATGAKVHIGDGACVEEGLLKRRRLDANNSGSRFARGLLKALFTKEELFGRPSNAHKGLPQKEPLDFKKVNAILDYTTQHFSVLPGQLKNFLSSLLARRY
ncbi:uncharacterized protein [Dermacentor andersoni]|uniref:uncharacterized protein isoform X2 n=1 Tax=Dermacentor andersoni TaxID=34620 RepID=UPI00241793DB|nr:uncharacterized protein LOC126540307 isoform X2 [Dermacentor andersoni]